MATKAELEQRAGWAEEIRLASTWFTGPRRLKLINLADRVDPETESPESPDEVAARQTAEREAAEAEAQAAEAEAAKIAKAAEK